MHPSVDVMKTYQIGGANDGGYNLKVVPMTTESVINEIHCFLVNGSLESPVLPQSVFPDMNGFTV